MEKNNFKEDLKNFKKYNDGNEIPEELKEKYKGLVDQKMGVLKVYTTSFGLYLSKDDFVKYIGDSTRIKESDLILVSQDEVDKICREHFLLARLISLKIKERDIYDIYNKGKDDDDDAPANNGKIVATLQIRNDGAVEEVPEIEM